MNFTNFDQRRYPTVTPKVGYAEWANTHEASVPSLLDIGILERIRSVRWSETRQCLDLACGTGRTGSWLATKGVSQIDGVDFHTGNAYAPTTRNSLLSACIRSCS